MLLLAAIWLPATALIILAWSLEDPGPTMAGALLLKVALSAAVIGRLYAAVAVFGFTDSPRGTGEVFP